MTDEEEAIYGQSLSEPEDDLATLRAAVSALQAEIERINRTIRHIMQALYCGAPG